MSLLSDNRIRQLCQPPVYVHRKDNGVLESVSEPFSISQIENLDNNNSIVYVEDAIINNQKDIIKYVENWKPMISPYFPELLKELDQNKCCSYGPSSYGYDARLADDLRIFTNINSEVIDPYELNDSCYVKAEIRTDEKGRRYALLPPNSFMLGPSIEYFNIPRDVTVICLGKSTWARAGVTVLVTPLEAGWSGEVVIEIANTTTLPVKIYVGAGICQFMFFQSDDNCNVSYSDREGKYQGQKGVTLGKV